MLGIGDFFIATSKWFGDASMVEYNIGSKS